MTTPLLSYSNLHDNTKIKEFSWTKCLVTLTKLCEHALQLRKILVKLIENAISQALARLQDITPP